MTTNSACAGIVTGLLDPVGSLENTYESILLGARRIGHGLGYIKHPYLLNILRERQVAVESCPVRYKDFSDIAY